MANNSVPQPGEALVVRVYRPMQHGRGNYFPGLMFIDLVRRNVVRRGGGGWDGCNKVWWVVEGKVEVVN